MSSIFSRDLLLQQVGVAADMTPAEWEADIRLAKSVKIDGFALNIAAGDTNNINIIDKAFAAANIVRDFTLFFSFDYIGHPPGVPPGWHKEDVINLIKKYSKTKGYPYTQYREKPLVSTFEGKNNTGDWPEIKNQTGCFFVPDWSSLSYDDFKRYLDTVDGAFSWNAWPDGATDMNTSADLSWKAAIGGKAYMMPVSPWFYTNLPDKNWLWRGDDMWNHRWEQIIEFQPDLVEILTWNDYGESHYVGPIHPAGIRGGDNYPGGAWYVNGMHHTGWLAMLPYYIDAYKAGHWSSLAGKPEKISFWYKVNPGNCGSDGKTTGNDPKRGQTALSPGTVSQDKVFLDVLVSSSNATSVIVVKIGSSDATTMKTTKVGINHFSVPLNNRTGAVVFQIKRNDQVMVSVTGPEITNNVWTFPDFASLLRLQRLTPRSSSAGSGW